MTLEDKVRHAEAQLFDAAGLIPQTSFVQLSRAGVRLRALSFGDGPPLVLLHGVASSSAAWSPLLQQLDGYRIHAVDLPGHGLSGPFTYRRGDVRRHTLQLIDDLFETLGLGPTPVVGHSLGGMFALWHAATRPGWISSLVVFGDPAVALPGVAVRNPLSLMTVRVIGPAMLRIPSSHRAYRQLFGMGNGRAAASAAPSPLVDALRFAGRRPGNARTVGSLMHAINGFRRPRPESVMSVGELGQVAAPTLFIWGTDDPYLAPRDARPWIEKMPAAVLHEVPAGHAPWFEEPADSARLLTQHLANTGFPPDEQLTGSNPVSPASTDLDDRQLSVHPERRTP